MVSVVRRGFPHDQEIGVPGQYLLTAVAFAGEGLFPDYCKSVLRVERNKCLGSPVGYGELYERGLKAPGNLDLAGFKYESA